MASNGKTKMAFKQRALMFTSRGELSTQALQNVLASRQATPTRRDALVSDGARSSGKGGPSSGASSSKVASSTNAGGGCDSDCIEVLNVSDLPESVDVGGAVEGVKKRKRTEPKRRFQETWPAKFPWCEQQITLGNFDVVRCKICTRVEGTDLILESKIDGLKKHEASQKHRKAEKVYLSIPVDSIATIVSRAAVKGKKVEVAILFHMLSHGRPMVEYESMQLLLEHLGVPKLPKKHWSDNSGWEISEAIHRAVELKTKALISSSRCLSLSCDEVTTVDNQSWLSIHAYIVRDFERVPMLLKLERVTDGASAENLTKAILKALADNGSLGTEQIRARLLCFGADGASVLQGKNTGVMSQIRNFHAPFMQSVHCVSHRSNLAVECLSELDVVARIELLITSMHSYFAKSPKRHSELEKLSELLDSNGGKMLRDVSTRWISMLAPAKRILSEYRVLLVKMYSDQFAKPVIRVAKRNFETTADVKNLVALAATIPLLECVRNLVVFSQCPSVYVCDFTKALSLCCADLHDLYLGDLAWKSSEFSTFISICEISSETYKLWWQEDLNDGEEYLVFEAHLGTRAGAHLNAYCRDGKSGVPVLVTRHLFQQVVAAVKSEVVEAAGILISELSLRFPSNGVMDSLSIVYPQFWKDPERDTKLPTYLSILKSQFAVDVAVPSPTSPQRVKAVLNSKELDKQLFMFKIAMEHNCDAALRATDMHIHPITKLWRKLASNPVLLKSFSEYFKLAEVALIQVLGSVEDERCFSTVSFLKTKLRNRLVDHLPLVVSCHKQSHFTLLNLPYDEIIDDWRSCKLKRGRYGLLQ